MSTSTIPCPMCKQHDIEEKELVTLDYEECRVKTADGWVSFKKATEDYLRSHFRSFETRTYKVPRMFSYDHKDDRLNFKCNYEVTDKEVLIDRQQRDAVEKVAQAICRWGETTSEAMFVVSEFRFCNFLKHLDLESNQVNSATAVTRSDVHVYSGDHDIVVINLSRGIAIFVQVKSIVPASSKKTRRTQLTKSMEQLAKDKVAIKRMNRDLSFVQDMKSVCIAAVPNLDICHIREVFVCQEHQATTLTANYLENDDIFFRWWEDKLEGFPRKNPPIISADEYCKLSGRYVGLASVMNYRTLPEAISKVGNKIWYRGVILPTPEQKSILDEESGQQKKKILCGDFGTGKSLLLMKKAEQLAKRDKVVVISFSVVSDGSGKVQDEYDNCVDHLKRMTATEVDDQPNLTVTNFLDQLRAVGSQSLCFPEHELVFPFQLTPDMLKEVLENTCKQNDGSGGVHFFLDELPLCITKCENGWSPFEKFCSDRPDMFVWMAFSCCSYALTVGQNYDSLTDLLPSSPLFSISSLSRCMRMTRKGFNLVRAVRKFKGDGHFDLAECDNVIDGPDPKWLEITSCQCGENTSPYECECVGGRRLRNAIGTILKELQGIQGSDITIVLHDTTTEMNRFLARVVKEACTTLMINCEFKVSSIDTNACSGNSDTDPGITVVDFWSYKGNESKVLIYVDPYGGPIVWNVESRWTGYQDVAGTLSRSIAQIFYITWPAVEQERFLIDLAIQMEKSAPSAPDQLGRDFKLGVARAIRNGRKTHSGRTFMEYLTSEGVITKTAVNVIKEFVRY